MGFKPAPADYAKEDCQGMENRPERGTIDEAQKAKLIFISLAVAALILLIISFVSGNKARTQRDAALKGRLCRRSRRTLTCSRSSRRPPSPSTSTARARSTWRRSVSSGCR